MLFGVRNYIGQLQVRKNGVRWYLAQKSVKDLWNNLVQVSADLQDKMMVLSGVHVVCALN